MIRGSKKPAIQVARIDHLVLTVRDINVTWEFYSRVLGMQAVTFGNGRRALRFGEQKINLHEVGKEFERETDKSLYGASKPKSEFVKLTQDANVV